MKRVLQIGMHEKLGGVETFLMNYYRHIDRNQIQFDFINMYEENLCFSEEIEKLGGKIYEVKNVKKHPLQYLKQIKDIILENKYDIVHINMLSAANIMPLLAADYANVKHIIVHSHNNNVPKGITRKILNYINKKIIIKKATNFFACSEEAGKWMFGEKTKFTIITNAIDMNKFKFDYEKRIEIRKKYNIKDEFVIGHVGRFEEQKNHKFLIEIFENVKKNRKDAKLLLIGDGVLRKNIEQKVKEKKIEKDVIFIGNSYNVNDFYQAMDIFVFPSLFEGLGIALIEAQSNGLKCLTSKETVPKEADISNNTKYISLNNKPQEWCKEIMQTKIEREENYFNQLEKKYDINIAAKKLEEIYTNL